MCITVPTEKERNFVTGDGNFAVVRMCKDKNTGKEYALKVIDKAKCKGIEHYVEAEVIYPPLLNTRSILYLLVE